MNEGGASVPTVNKKGGRIRYFRRNKNISYTYKTRPWLCFFLRPSICSIRRRYGFRILGPINTAPKEKKKKNRDTMFLQH